ncbi:putative glutathione S-transferase [Mollisia scopiformis]|uniref:glutathione transferase n=1 Tax=Mollisia scopiformis TaxID=149040 RepID=A0A132BCM8_MOLSC|nr:putative glutathione S-transferase [Mollisia scopiformis]KUJ10146.1 putative glutathione S-transferase [Mollisia scopiformis]
MVIKVHGVAQSTCTQRVLTALIEKNVPYELVKIDFMTGEHKSEAFLKMQPFGKVPALEEDGVFIFESRAIAKYIARKFAGQGTKLMPADDDLIGYALFEQGCSLENAYFDKPASSIAYEKMFKKFRGLGGPDEALVKKYSDDLDGILAVYDGILAKQAYLAGDKVSLADLFHLPYGNVVKQTGGAELFAKHPNVDRWFTALENRESWVKIGQLQN